MVLGIVQGITEFLPVSSSGHLILVPELLGWPLQSAAFDAVMHWATLAAVIVALWPDVREVIVSVGSRKKSDWKRLGVMIAVATIPAVVIGLLFDEMIETTLRSPIVVAVSLAIWGVLLFIADRLMKPSAVSDVKRVGWRSVAWIGLAQAIALIPGTSRSGVTITAGLFTGLNRETAARFSFLLGIPAIALAGAAGMLDVVRGNAGVEPLPLAVGFVSAFAAGFFSIRLLLRLLKSGSYAGFAVYRVLLAAVVLWVFLK